MQAQSRAIRPSPRHNQLIFFAEDDGLRELCFPSAILKLQFAGQLQRHSFSQRLHDYVSDEAFISQWRVPSHDDAFDDRRMSGQPRFDLAWLNPTAAVLYF